MFEEGWNEGEGWLGEYNKRYSKQSQSLASRRRRVKQSIAPKQGKGVYSHYEAGDGTIIARYAGSLKSPEGKKRVGLKGFLSRAFGAGSGKNQHRQGFVYDPAE